MQGSVEQIIMRQRVNLVPQQALAEKLKKITVPLICVLIAVGGVSIFINGQMIERKISRIEQKIEALNKRQQALIAQQTAIGQLSLSVKKMEGEIIQRRKTISNLSELPSQKKKFSTILAGIAQVLPSSARCEKISLKDDTGIILGQAVGYNDLPRFVKQLEALPELYSVSLQVLNQKQNGDMEMLSYTIHFQMKESR